ncbi:MAG: hypothetical protein HQL15_07950 [Candidatus Omnitrophica bacterium]|nr:hypothetical protein [Candidatus Omnitrophota bacterium]
MRGVIKGVLAEELKNSLKMQKDYERSLKALPQGCLAKRVVRGRAYYYLVRREGQKVIYKYKGIILPQEINRYREAKEKRAQYRGLLSRVKKQVRYLKGALRGKEAI